MKSKNATHRKDNLKVDVRALTAMVREVEKQAAVARKRSKLAKARFKKARKLYKLAKKAARLARKEAKAAAALLQARTRKRARPARVKQSAEKRITATSRPRKPQRRSRPAKPATAVVLPVPSAPNGRALAPDQDAGAAQP